MATVSTKGGYNEQDYNEPLYNDNDIYLTATESISSTDGTDTFDVTSLKVETLTLIDNLQKYFNGAIFADMLTPSDTIINYPQLVKLETITSSDTLVSTVYKVLLETITLTDTRTMDQTRSLVEFILLVDSITKQITDKRLADSIRLQDWISVRKNPAANIWSD